MHTVQWEIFDGHKFRRLTCFCEYKNHEKLKQVEIDEFTLCRPETYINANKYCSTACLPPK